VNGIDIVVLVLVLIFTLRGLRAGFIKELLSLVGLIIAIYVSLRFNDLMGFYLKGIKDPLLLKVLSIVILFVLVLFLTNLVIFLTQRFLKPGLFGFANKILGLLFGFLEGFILCGAILFFVGRFNVFKSYIGESAYSGKVSFIFEKYVVSHFSDLKDFFEISKGT